MSIDQPLESVVSDSWDRQAFLKEYEESEGFTRRTSEVIALLNKNKFDAAVELATEIEKSIESPKFKQSAKSLINHVRASELQYNVLKKNPQSVELLRDILKGAEPEAVNQILWNSIVKAGDGRKLKEELVEVALEFAKQNAKVAPEDAHYLDTLAHLQEMKGDIEAAIETQTKAVKFADEKVREQYAEYLKKLEESK